jgi:hypothetical protein
VDTGPVDLVEVGDWIAILAGLEMLLVLRPVGNGIGERGEKMVVYGLAVHVYVHWVMYGEAWDTEDGRLRVEEIFLV